MADRRASNPVPAIGAALFCVVLILLAVQVRAGGDPALGAAKPAAQPARPVVVRRVIVTKRVVDSGGRGRGRDTPTAAGGSAPATSPAAPAAAAPAAPPAAAAPAPAAAPPAPVVSRGS